MRGAQSILGIPNNNVRHRRRCREAIRTCFSKEWDNNKSATEIAEELRSSRSFTDRITEW